MAEMSKTAKQMIVYIAILAPVEIVAGIFLLRNTQWVSGHVAGVLFGSACSLLNLYLLEKAINKALELEKRDSSIYYRRNYIFRTVVKIAALGVSAYFHPKINLLSMAIGLINMSIAAYLYKFFNKEN